MEVEIKLTVRPAIPGGPDAFFRQLAAVTELVGLPLGPVRRLIVQDTYYDTPSLRLGQASAGLRLRVENDRTLVTLKRNRTQRGALTQREEHEVELTQANLEAVLTRVRAEVGPGPFPVSDFAALRSCGSLVPVLRVHTTRLARSVGLAAELTLDLVTYPDLVPEPYHDIEVEARDGVADEPLLRRVEAELRILAQGQLDPATISKLERGYRLMD